MNFTHLVESGKYSKEMLTLEQQKLVDGMETARDLIDQFKTWKVECFNLNEKIAIDKIRLDCMEETMSAFAEYLRRKICEGIVTWADMNAASKSDDKKKAMLSQPMNGLASEEIATTRERAILKLESLGYEVVNTYFTDEWYSEKSMEERGVVQKPMCFLAKSLENMSKCHAAYFCKGWENARGCKIEHDAAVAYGLTVIEE